MKKLFSVRLWTILSTVISSLLVVLIIGTNVAQAYAPMINVTLQIQTYDTVDTGDASEDTEYFKADYKTRETIKDYAAETSKAVEAEGLVLLKNENGALPLEKSAKVSLFGAGSAYLNCSAQGMRNANDKKDFPTLKDALEKSGLSVNPDLWAFYTTGAAKDYGGTKQINETTGLQTYYINEAPWTLYDANLRGTFSSYGDAAIVVLTRDSTEGSDVNTTYSDGKDGDYLTLHENETRLLTELSTLKANGVFARIVVLLNSAVHLQLDFMDDPAILVDACMWIGNTGMTGIEAVAGALVGDVNPSGRLTDTLVKDNFSSPAMASLSFNEYKTFSRAWDNAALNATNSKYGVYVEGIYVGYRYYETRYTDLVEARPRVGMFDYTAAVAYPFGYGLSYTSFSYSDFSVKAGDGTFDVSVTVTNTGERAGKNTVQIYLQKPYTEYAQSVKMETASVELVGYAKTGMLAPAASETVTVSVEKELLASYDVYGAGTYVLDAGDYYLTAADNAHDAANNILAKKGYAEGMIGSGNPDLVSGDFIKVTELDAETYSVSSETGSGTKIGNKLGEMDLMRYSGVGGNYIEYVSRSDWEGTFPKAAADIALTGKMIADLQNVDVSDVESEGSLPTFEAFDGDNALTLAMMRGKAYDDPDWEKLLDQLSFDELNTLMTTAICNTSEIASVVKPRTREQDGPTYCKESNNYDVKMNTRFPCEGIWAATFNNELITEVAKAIANEAVYEDEDFLRYTGMYAPGLNIHRLTHGGRNHEYFSEDPYLTGIAGQNVIEGFQSLGVIAFPKHFIFNDQEVNRNGVGVWLNEQAAREIYLKPWKYALSPRRGNSHALMSSFNRAGTKWTSATKALIDIAREEFGFDGFVLTDMADSNGATYMTTLDGILAGTDAWLSSGGHSFYQYRDNPTIVNKMRESAHRIMFVTANYSYAMNGISTTTRIVPLMVWWEVVLTVALVVLAVLTAGSVGMLAFSLIRKRKESGGSDAQ